MIVNDVSVSVGRGSINPVSITKVEGITNPVSRAKVENITNPISHTIVEGVTNPVSRAKVEDITNPVSRAKVEGFTNPVSRAKVEGITNPVSRTKVEGITKSLQQTVLYSQDNGQIWAIIGCVLTIGNIIAAFVIYTRRRKRKLRKRENARVKTGSVPSESHYTLPTNQDPHYLQIRDSLEGSATRKRTDVDEDGYITAIGEIEKSYGYTEILQLSTSQRSNSHYQHIIDVEDLSTSSHLLVHGTRSLDRNWCDEDSPKDLVDVPLRIHKRKDQHLVNIVIPSDSELTGEVRESCVLSPDLMDDGLFESLHNFAKYFTSLSVKKKKQSFECQRDVLTPGEDKDDSSDVKEMESREIETRETEENLLSRYLHIEEKDIEMDNNKNGNENPALISTLPIHVSQKETHQSNGNEGEMKELNSSSISEHQQVPSGVEHRRSTSPLLQERSSENNTEEHASCGTNDQTKSSIFIPQLTESSEENKFTVKNTRKDDVSENKHIPTIAPNVDKFGTSGSNALPLKNRNVLLEQMSSFDSDHSLNKYVRKNGILLPVKNSPDDKDATDTQYKRDTI